MDEESSAPVRGASPRALSAAVEIYARWEKELEKSPLDRVVAAEFRSRRYLNASERRWIAESIYGSVRYLRLLTRLLQERNLPDTPDNRLNLWSEGLPDSFGEGPGVRLRLLESFPDAMAQELEAQLGVEAEAAGAAFNRQAPTALRINALRTTRRQVQELLPETRPTRYSPWGLELPKRVNIYDLPGFRDGLFELQEEASQLAALLTDARPGQTLVEVGAGAGGKTLALAAMMQNKGRVFALDTSASRLEELHKRAHRAGARNIQTQPLAANEFGEWQLTGASLRNIERLRGKADCVFLDAPCSGSGVIRRSPDAKWRHVDYERLFALQETLLRQSSAFTAPGGVLIYITCAFERSQNEAVVAAFLDSPAGAEFQVEPVLPRLQSACRMVGQPEGETPLDETASWSELESLVTGPYLRTWPHRHNLDSFFAACLRRTAPE